MKISQRVNLTYDTIIIFVFAIIMGLHIDIATDIGGIDMAIEPRDCAMLILLCGILCRSSADVRWNCLPAGEDRLVLPPLKF